MWLDWHVAAWLGALLGAVGVTVRPKGRRGLTIIISLMREVALMLGLYALWRLAGTLSVMEVDRALDRGQFIFDFERALHLPSELTLQRWALEWLPSVRFANWYYYLAHVPMLGAFLVWLYVRHRESYPGWRNILAVLTFTCLMIQLIPVAPPRMYPQLGFIDTGAVFGPTVYGRIGTGVAAQLSAMPSVHIGWAMIIGIGIVRISTNPWRWFALMHPIFTWWAVTVTAYHWLADGLVATAVLVLAMVLGAQLRPVRQRFLRSSAPEMPPSELGGERVPVPSGSTPSSLLR